jgi:hypothetical protein
MKWIKRIAAVFVKRDAGGLNGATMLKAIMI